MRASALTIATAAGAVLALTAGCTQESDRLRLSTTTSVENSGLLAAILPGFEALSGVEVQAIAVGSGRALEILDRGDSDAALTHDPDAEQRLVDRGSVADYRKVMFNDFVIAGPGSDPAGLRNAPDVSDAMRRLHRANAPCASRADSSGTHMRELRLWTSAGVSPFPASRIETGQGMTATLRVASERQAYVLTDRSTLRQIEHSLNLSIVFEGDPALLNTYAVLYMADLPSGRRARVREFVSWLTDGRGRQAISEYQIKGQAAFAVWPTGAPRARPADLPPGR